MPKTIKEKHLDSDGLLYIVQRLNGVLIEKVDTKDGYSLMSDDEIKRLASVTNYDDSEIRNSIVSLLNKVETLEKGAYDDKELRNLIASCQEDIISLKKYVDDSISTYLSDNSILNTLIETDMLPAVKNSDGKILSNGKGQVLLRY